MKTFNIENLRNAVTWVKAQGWVIRTGIYWQKEDYINLKLCCPYTAFLAWQGLIDIDKGWADKDREIKKLNRGFSRGAFVHGFDDYDHSDKRNKYYQIGVQLRKDLKI